MDAVGYYAVRDLACLRDDAYWYYCERQWKRAKPAAYPSFRERREASEHSDDRVIDASEIRDKERELIKAAFGSAPECCARQLIVMLNGKSLLNGRGGLWNSAIQYPARLLVSWGNDALVFWRPKQPRTPGIQMKSHTCNSTG